MNKSVLKVCGLTYAEIDSKLMRFKLSGVDFDVEEVDLDACITMTSHLPYDKFDVVRTLVFNTFADEIYSDFDDSLQNIAARLLKMHGHTLSVAESLTGGEICSKLIEVPGISNNFYEGIVCYNSASKMQRLGVRETTLAKFGAISKQTAYEMVIGITRDNADLGLATTGLAGPSGDEGKPVGLVYIGVGAGDYIAVFERKFSGSREDIRKAATNVALFYLIRYLKGSILTLT